jgi:hypothetical protein
VIVALFWTNVKNQLSWFSLPKQPNVDAYEAFLRDHPSSEHAAEVAGALDDLLWINTGRGTNQLQYLYQDYLSRFPTGKHSKEASIKLEDLVWSQVVTNGQKDSFESFLQGYPNSLHRCAALYEVCKAAVRRACLGTLANECQGESGNWASKQLISLNKQDDTAFHQASTKGTSAAYFAYVRAFPDGLHSRQAQTNADDAAFRAAKSKNTSSAYSEYLTSFPSGAHSSEAATLTEELKDLEAFRAIETTSQFGNAKSAAFRYGVHVVLIDEGPHADAVKNAVASQIDSRIKNVDIGVLPKSRSLIQNLAEVLKEKLAAPRHDFIVNMSWTYDDSNVVHRYVFERLSRAGIAFVAAVGNEKKNTIPYPAGYASVIGVGSIDRYGIFMPYTNRGDGLRVCATDRSDEGEKEIERKIEREVFDGLMRELESETCREIVSMRYGRLPDQARINKGVEGYVMRRIEVERKLQGVASGTSIAAGAFSGYLANILATHPEVSLAAAVKPYTNSRCARVPVEFGSGSVNDASGMVTVRIPTRLGCDTVTGILDAARDSD